MLSDRYGSSLDKLIAPYGQVRPFPDSLDRAAWVGLPVEMKNKLVAAGEQALGSPWPELPASLYLEFPRLGTRANFEAAYLPRRSLLAKLVLAECVEGRGRFLDAAVNAIWSICEESSWCLPALINMQKAGSSLPVVAEPVVDLFVAETGAQLAWVDYLLAGQLERISPVIRPRLLREIHQRILSPCLARDDFWFLGFIHANVNNWNPWINSNWLACVLLLENDTARRLAAVKKILRSVDKFIDVYGDDGGCDEGPGYWTRAGASLFDCLELLYWASGGKISVYGEPKIANIARFVYRAHIADRWFVNFADAAARMEQSASLLYRFGQRISDERLMGFGAYFREGGSSAAPHISDNGTRSLPAVFGYADLVAAIPGEPLPRDVWLGDIQVMVARTAEGSAAGLTVAAKGGHNDESHNHNDVGQFIVYADGDPLLIDIGVETYTRKTFSAQRYEIWTMRSLYHNLPSVNGCEQLAGRQFAAHDVKYQADDAVARLSLGIAPAYDPKAGVARWSREVALDRTSGAVNVTDDWELAALANDITWSLLTPCRVALQDGWIALARRPLPNGQSGAGGIEYDATTVAASIEEIPVTDANLASVWGDRLYRILLTARRPVQTGRVVLRVIREPDATSQTCGCIREFNED